MVQAIGYISLELKVEARAGNKDFGVIDCRGLFETKGLNKNHLGSKLKWLKTYFYLLHNQQQLAYFEELKRSSFQAIFMLL